MLHAKAKPARILLLIEVTQRFCQLCSKQVWPARVLAGIVAKSHCDGGDTAAKIFMLNNGCIMGKSTC